MVCTTYVATADEFRNRSFEEFLNLPEYHNVATRMFSRDVHAYGGKGPKDRTMGRWLVDSDLVTAQATLDKFALVAIMETFGSSLLLLALEFGVRLERGDFLRQRADHTPSYSRFSASLKANPNRRAAILQANRYDVELYKRAWGRHCTALRDAGLLGPGEVHPVVARDFELSGYSCDS